MHDIHNANVLLLVQYHSNIVQSIEFIGNCSLIVEHTVPINLQQNLTRSFHPIVLDHDRVQLLFQPILLENFVAKTLLGGPPDVRIELDQIL